MHSHLDSSLICAFHLDELSDEDTLRVRVSLAECATCAAEATAYCDIIQGLAAMPPLDPSPTFAARVMSRVAVRRTLPAWARAAAVIFTAVPSAVLSVLATWLLVPGSGRYAAVRQIVSAALKPFALELAARAWGLATNCIALYENARATLGSSGMIGASAALGLLTTFSAVLLVRTLLASPVSITPTNLRHAYDH